MQKFRFSCLATLAN